jgi:flagellar protein FliS
MIPNKALDSYAQNSIFTASPEELTLMLYNGLVKFIMQAQYSIRENKADKAHDLIMRAQNIIIEFRETLDMNYELSEGLDLIYDYMYRRLIDANVKKDVNILEEVLGFAKELRETWSQAMKLAKIHPQMNTQQVAEAK